MITEMRLKKMAIELYEVRAELRLQGASEAAIRTASEDMVRTAWEPLVPPEKDWPGYFRVPRCAYCDGTGLVLRFNVRNRLGVDVTEGSPCRCPLGVRFLPKPKDQDFTDAGKSVQKPRTWTQAGR